MADYTSSHLLVVFIGLAVLPYFSQVSGITRPTAITLQNNGYTKVLVAIDQDVAESQALLDSIEAMLKEASSYMHNATRKRAFFKEVTILVPATWKGNYSPATSQIYANADIVIEKANAHYGNDPFSRSYGGCGAAGIRVYLSDTFMALPALNLTKEFGPRGKVLLHQWAQFRWGVFNEYAKEGEQKFYFSPSTGRVEGVRCNIKIRGSNVQIYSNGTIIFCRQLDPNTGRFPDQCIFFINDRRTRSPASLMDRTTITSIVDFCDDDQSNPLKVHNSEAPNKHNRMCGQRSTWAVISETDDFKGGNNPPRDVTNTNPVIRIVKATSLKRVALALDTSGSMMNDYKLTHLRQTASNFIMNSVDADADVGVVAFADSAEVVRPMTPVRNYTQRRHLQHALPSRALGGTSIGDGVQKALKMLTANGHNASGAAIVVLTDGKETKAPFLSEVLTSVQEAGAILSIMAFSPNPDDNLATSATNTGGHFYYDSNQATSTSLTDALFDIYNTFRHDRKDNALQLMSKASGLIHQQTLSGTVNVDVDVGRKTKFMITYVLSEPRVIITSPTGRIYSKLYPEYFVNNDFKTILITIPEVAETGQWSYVVTNTDHRYQKVSIMAVSRPVDPSREPVKVHTSIQSSNKTWPTEVKIFAEVTKSFQPVTGLTVKAVIDRPFAEPYMIRLLDNGAGADMTKNDGVYSRYFTEFSGNGRYSVRIEVEGRDTAETDKDRLLRSNTLLDPGRIFKRSATGPMLSEISRTSPGGAFEIVHPNLTKSFEPFEPNMLGLDVYAPVRITDLKVMRTSHEESTIELSWTAPGDDIDHLTATRYQIVVAPTVGDMLQHGSSTSFIQQHEVIYGNLAQPKPAGSKEIFVLKLQYPPLSKISFVFSIRAVDEAGNYGQFSNYATAGFGYVPDYVDPDYVSPVQAPTTEAGPTDTQKLIIAGLVGSLSAILLVVIVVSIIVYQCSQRPVKPKNLVV